MANPSLQIGNSKWAIKEDNLLGYNTVGTNFLPIETTMTRASAGTRVNSSGLVETVELLGSEEVTCGNFQCAVPTGSWTLQNGSTISNSEATVISPSQPIGNGRAYHSLYQDNVFEVGKSYLVTFNAKQTVGSGLFQVGQGTALNSNLVITTSFVTYTWEFTAVSNTYETSLVFGGRTASNQFVIDNVSVKESTKNDLARVDYDGTASSLLVEPQRTNLIPYSEDFSQSTWIASNQTVSLSEVLSPNGTSFSYKLTATANYSKIREDLVLNATTTYTVSFYTKNISAANPRIVAYDQNNSVTLLTQSYGSELSNSEWVRITGTFTTTTAATIQLQICRDLMDSEEMLIWGAQLEESYATSYIPTSGSTVTRVQETYTKTGISSKINSEEGTLFVEMAALADDNSDRRITLTDGTLNNAVNIGFSRFTGNINGEIHSSGTQQTTGFGATGVTQTNNNKFAIRWGNSNYSFFTNGLKTNDLIIANSPTGLNVLKFSSGNNIFKMFAKVKQLKVFKTALTDTELATLTT